MASVYPGTLPSNSTKEDNVDVYAASHINKLQEDTVAIATELGTDPAGTSTDVKTRLAVSIHGDGSIAHSASFPGSPVAWQLYGYTTDGRMYYRNNANTDWLPMNQAFSLVSNTTVTAGTATSSISISAGKVYKLIITLENETASTLNVLFTVNGDTTGTDYTYANSVITFATTPTETHSGSAGAAAGFVLGAIRQDNGFIIGEYLLNTYQNQTSSFNLYLIGSSVQGNTGGTYQRVDLSGMYTGGSPTSFTINGDQNFDATVTLYELFTS